MIIVINKIHIKWEIKMAIFASLSEKLSSSIKKISGKASLSEKNIQDTLREVRIALLEADVALPVVKNFLSDVKDRALGTEVSSSLDPGQQFLKIVSDFSSFQII